MDALAPSKSQLFSTSQTRSCIQVVPDWTDGLDGHETEKKEGIETDQRRTADTRNEKRVALLPLLGNVMIHTSEDLGLKL